MRKKIEEEILEMCEFYHCDLVMRHYGTQEICFTGLTGDDEELFNICLGYRKNCEERYIKFDINTEHERQRGYSFTKNDILLLLELDNLNDDELHIKKIKETYKE